ncbi:MAG TPA: cupin domain-containing protein [Thermomicrobiaceae bacterium]|nr:cupin domain-containing protein [Thermomicrobiaceae bacterium]
MSETILGRFDFDSEIERFAPGEGASGRRAETLIKTDGLRVVLVTMRAGAALHEHTAPGPITIQALRGHLTVSVEGTNEEQQLQSGQLIAIAPGVRHAVRAQDAAAFLLTIG